MTNTENKFEYNGLIYIAVEADGCLNCEFNSGKTNCASYDCSYGLVYPSCSSVERDDSIDVIFVLSDIDNKWKDK